MNSGNVPNKAPCLLTLARVEYYENLATVSLRRLIPRRSDSLARSSIRGWIRTLRDAQRVRAYRNWLS